MKFASASSTSPSSSIPRSNRLKLIIFGGAIAMSSIFQFGYSNAYPNTAIDGFRDYLNQSLIERDSIPLTDNLFIWLWSALLNIWFIGFFIGNWLAIPISDRLGRKIGLLCGNSLSLFATIIMLLAIIRRIPELFAIGRLLAAISSGISMCSVILFLQETAPTEMRGIMSFYAEMSFVFMTLVGIIAGMSFVFGQNLLHLIAFAIIPGVLAIAIVLPFPETPKFLLIVRNNRQLAEKSLNFYQGAKKANDAILESIRIEGGEHNKNISPINILRTAHLRRALLLGCVALQLTTGLWPTLYLSTDFLRRVNISDSLSEWASTIMLVLSTISTTIGMFVVDRFGRRPLLIGFGAANMTAMLIFVICAVVEPMIGVARYGCVAMLFVYGITYSFALGPIAWFITAELVPQSHRSLTQSIALSFNQLMSLVLGFVTLPAYDLFNAYALLPLFVLPGIGCLIILYKYLPETRNKEIHEIVQQLKQIVGANDRQQQSNDDCDVIECHSTL